MSAAGMLVRLGAVVMSRRRMLLGLGVAAMLVMVGSLAMMMGGGLMVSRGRFMVLRRRMGCCR